MTPWMLHRCTAQELFATMDSNTPLLPTGGVDLVLIVAEPSLSGLSDMKRILKTAAILGTRAVVCVNKADVSPGNADAIEQYCKAQGIAFMGRIPYDRQAAVAINAGGSLADVPCPARDALYQVYVQTMIQLQGGAA